MEKYVRFFKEETSIFEQLKSFNRDAESVNILRTWLFSLNLKTGKAPSGMVRQYKDIQFLQRQIDSIDLFYKGMENEIPKSQAANNIRITLDHLSIDDLEKLNVKLSKENRGIVDIELKNAHYKNNSNISEKNFISFSKQIDTFLSTLKDFHKKALFPKLTIIFVKKEDSKAKATYKSQVDVVYLRPDKIKAGNEYASFNYVVVHELGHRYLAFNKVNFDYDSSSWITTPYSKVDSMRGEEKFAELFALSHFKYTGKPFDGYKNKIAEFGALLK